MNQNERLSFEVLRQKMIVETEMGVAELLGRTVNMRHEFERMFGNSSGGQLQVHGSNGQLVGSSGGCVYSSGCQ